MNMFIMFGFIALTILSYQAMKLLYTRVNLPILVPIATTTFLLIIILLMTDISYETYMIGGKWIGELLGPAVVALAIPLYQHRKTLVQYFIPVMTGVLVGSSVGMLTGLFAAMWFKFDQEVILSMVPKSVTTPVAMDIADMTGGIPTLASIFVMIAGISGSMFGPNIFRKFGISHYIGVGVGFGTASHGIGTARALEMGKSEAAISSIAMIVSATYMATIGPYLIRLIFS